MEKLKEKFKKQIDSEINKLNLLLNKIDDDFSEKSKSILEEINELKDLKGRL